ncbi:MAG: NUDIX domain-containing protein [Dehalococcoidia bacterium]|nr:NUDIX domain-containing protein [Dehalococcoidia bacterium]
MGFAQFRDDGRIFQVRVGVVARSNGRVLLHRTAGDDIWSLPGGRLMVGETAAQAAMREMREEAGAEVQPGELLWVIENFFRANALDAPGVDGAPADHHEVGLYVAVRLPPHLEQAESFTGVEREGTPHEFALEFRWFGLDALDGIDLRPASLRERLAAGGAGVQAS